MSIIGGRNLDHLPITGSRKCRMVEVCTHTCAANTRESSQSDEW